MTLRLQNEQLRLQNQNKNQQIDKNMLENMKQIGKKELITNPFFNDMNELMQNKVFKTFYDKYFKDSSDIKTVLLYLKLYETLQIEYKDRNNKDIDEEVLIYAIKELMTTKISRQNIIQAFDIYFNQNTITHTLKNSQSHKYKYLLDILSPQIQQQLEQSIQQNSTIVTTTLSILDKYEDK